MTVLTAHPNERPRLGALVLVAAVHLLVGYAFVTGLGVDARRVAETALKVFDLPAAPPPPPPSKPEPIRRVTKPRAAALPAKTIGGAPPVITVAPVMPVLAPPSPAAGNGTGRGTGDGVGPGDGGRQGSGEGGMTPARWLKGEFHDSDVPRALRKIERVEFAVRIAIGPDGRIGDCTLIESSGHPELDAVACGVMQRRFRFAPARDARGDPITEVREETEGWILDPPRNRG